MGQQGGEIKKKISKIKIKKKIFDNRNNNHVKQIVSIFKSTFQFQHPGAHERKNIKNITTENAAITSCGMRI